MKEYFVMLNNQNGSLLIPLMYQDELQMFESVKEATIAAESSFMGKHFGFDVFRKGEGEQP